MITFSGHGFDYEGDAIAVIPEKPKGGEIEARFINMSGLARKFAGLKNTLNVFIMSMCRVFPDAKKIREPHPLYKNFEADALGKNKVEGWS